MSKNINMLGIRKVKLHGMSSTKWTTKDKLIQYKGLINLYTRDRKVIEFDTNVARKKLDQDLKQLQKNVEKDRAKLDNVIRGDKQQLRNILAEHKEMQLAHQNSPPKKVIESVQQINFAKRKCSDRLGYEMNQRVKHLEDLKLYASVLEDRLKYSSLGQIRQEKEAQIITGKVQDAILKREGAISIRQSYLKMIDIMKKDALYFNAILDTIQNDGLIQNRCFLNATKLGQLATEYLDDRRLEYISLEKVVMQDLGVRRSDLNALITTVNENVNKIKKLLRKDDDVTLCNIPGAEDSPRSKALKKDAKSIESSLEILKGATLATNYEKIYPCLQDQAMQKERLTELYEKLEKSRGIITVKLEHANQMSHKIRNTMVETTGDYKKRKAEIKEEMKRILEKKHETKALIEKRNSLMAELAVGLKNIEYFVKHGEKDSPKKRGKSLAPEKEVLDHTKIVPSIIESVTVVVGHAKHELNETQQEDAFKLFESLIKSRTVVPDFEGLDFKRASLLSGMYSEKSHLITREDIKKFSKEIVEANTKNDDLIPLMPQPSKKRKF